jgi:hypothetical protein
VTAQLVQRAENIMNKKIITLASIGVIGAVFLLWAVQSTFDRLMPYGNKSVSGAIDVMATVLIFPVRLYAFFVYGYHGSWSMPVLVSLLGLSCLMWGIIVERIVWISSKTFKRNKHIDFRLAGRCAP